MRVPTIQRVNVCSFCKGKTHIIDPRVYPNDAIAKKDDNGKWICGNCQESEIQDMIKASKKRRGLL